MTAEQNPVAAGRSSGAARRRMLVAFAAGVAVGAAAAAVAPWQLSVLVGFDAWAAVQLIWIARVLRLDGPATRAAAQIEDDSRAQANMAINGSGLASLAGVALALSKARQVGPVQAPLLTVAALATVALAWASVHTVFTLRYARQFYSDGEVGGIDFGKDTPLPDYRDFVYFGFTIGMTFQVSDTNISDPLIRRTVTRHALVSFLFSTVIIGLTINVMAGFIG